MKRIVLNGGITAVVFDTPPEGFNPFEATPAELRRYGLPAIPENPRHLERYKKVWGQLTHETKFVEPAFRLIPQKQPAGGGGSPSPSGTSPNWSGSVVYPPQGQSFQWIHAEWVVPSLKFPGLETECQCASWIGIDGVSADNGLQAGVFSTLSKSGNNSNIRALFYWIWNGVALDFGLPSPDIAVSAGDQVTVTVCSAQGAGSTTATIFFVNLTTGQSTHFAVESTPQYPEPSGPPAQLAGMSAEWIVSVDPGWQGESPFGTLGDYGEVLFKNSVASVTPGNTSVDGGTGETLDIVADGQVISQGILIDPTTVKCIYGAPPSAPVPVSCPTLLENIEYEIGDGRHLPVSEHTLTLWEVGLATCLREEKISPAQYTYYLNLIQNYKK